MDSNCGPLMLEATAPPMCHNHCPFGCYNLQHTAKAHTSFCQEMYIPISLSKFQMIRL